MAYFVYILQCADKTFYIGSTNDVKKRVLAHNTSNTGARYTKSRRPVKLKYSEKFRTKGRALKREWELKQLKREEKAALIKK